MRPKEALAVLVAAFRTEKLAEPTVRLYEHKLADIPPGVLAATVDRLVDTARFLPTVAEIRETAARLAGLLPADPEVALGVVRHADVESPVYRRDGTFVYSEREWRWPSELDAGTQQAIQAALALLGDPWRGEERVFGWEQDFKRVYAQAATELTRAALADLSRAALPAPAARASLPAAPETTTLSPEVVEANKAAVRGLIQGLTERRLVTRQHQPDEANRTDPDHARTGEG